MVDSSSNVDESLPGQKAIPSIEQEKPSTPVIVECSPNSRYAKFSSVLGKGSYKVVWHAIDRDEGVEVAWNCVKTTKSNFAELSREIEILSRVRHPNIITFHDSWYSENEFVFITELMTSGTLREYIKKIQPPNTKIVKRWCSQILRGLQYLHSHDPPIIHRDLKCDNIFINGSHGEVKIGDMGTAKMKLGKKYTVIGTPEFMAPEMYDDSGYSELVDVYAFGMCLLEMATGEYPYAECKNAAQVYRKVSQGIAPDSLRKVGDPLIRSLIVACTSPEGKRISVSAALEHPFLSMEPEVTIVAQDSSLRSLTMLLTLRGLNSKPSLKFLFAIDSDTAEVVAQEMIDEGHLPSDFRSIVANEINRLVREFKKTVLSTPKVNKSDSDSSTQSSPDMSQSLAKQLSITSAIATSKSGSSNEALLINLDDSDSESNYDSEHFSYVDDCPIEKFVSDAARCARRDPEKALEWINKLKSQDIYLVRDLRHLHDEDWRNLHLTVFASRALRNHLSSSTVAAPPLLDSTQSLLRSATNLHSPI